MQLHGIARFNLVTADLDRLAGFYRDVLRLPPAGGERAIDAAELTLLGVPGVGRRQCFTVGGQQIAIDQYSTPGQPYPADSNAASLWFQHFALIVADIEAVHAHLRHAAAISTDGPQRLPASSGGVTAFKFRDPDGHPLELLETGRETGGSDALVVGIDHSAIAVSDADRSAAFYGTYGLTPGPRTVNQGREQEQLDALPAVQVDVVPMIPPVPAPHLELLGYRSPHETLRIDRRVADVASTRIVWRGTQTALVSDPDGHLHQVHAEDRS